MNLNYQLSEMNRCCISVHVRSISVSVKESMHITFPSMTQLFQRTVWHPSGKFVGLLVEPWYRPGHGLRVKNRALGQAGGPWGTWVRLEEPGLSWRRLDQTHGAGGAAKALARWGELFLLEDITTWDQAVGSYYSWCDILGRYSPSFYLSLDINMLIRVLLLNSSLLNYILLSYLSIDMVLFCISYPNLLYCMRSCSRHWVFDLSWEIPSDWYVRRIGILLL